MMFGRIKTFIKDCNAEMSKVNELVKTVKRYDEIMAETIQRRGSTMKRKWYPSHSEIIRWNHCIAHANETIELLEKYRKIENKTKKKRVRMKADRTYVYNRMRLNFLLDDMVERMGYEIESEV